MEEDIRLARRREMVQEYHIPKPYNAKTDALLVRDFVRGVVINQRREVIRQDMKRLLGRR